MRRREFLGILGGAAAWPVASKAQQVERVRRVGVFNILGSDDPEGQARRAVFEQTLEQLGWTVGRDLKIETRQIGSDLDGLRRYAAELVALSPDVIFSIGSLPVAALQQATRTIPIVFMNATDPVGAGLVESMAHPGGNITGFSNFEYSMSGKWAELLKQIAPNVTRALVLRDPTSAAGIGQFGAVRSVAQSLGVELTRRSDCVERLPTHSPLQSDRCYSNSRMSWTQVQSDVRFGSKADMCSALTHVRFTPKSLHVRCSYGCPLWAKSGHQLSCLFPAEARRGQKSSQTNWTQSVRTAF